MRVLCTDPTRVTPLLTAVDSFGSNAVDLASEKSALLRAEGKDLTDINAILDILRQSVALLTPPTLEVNWTASFETREATVVQELAFERQRVLRLRNNLAEKERKVLKRVQQCKSVKDHYTPKYETVYCTNFPPWPLRLSTVDNFFPKHYAVPLLSADFCDALWQELNHYEQFVLANPQLLLPHDIRHDGNWGKLEDCGFQPFLDATQEALTPFLALNYAELGPLRCHHAFFARNFLEMSREASYKTHRDSARLTVNICIQKTEDTEGNGVFFYGETENSIIPDTSLCLKDHSLGWAIIHDGNSWHRTEPIRQGMRSSLILWMD